MDRSQARSVGIGASFVLAVIVGAITGFVAPQEAAETAPIPAEISATPSVVPTPSQTATTPQPTPPRSSDVVPIVPDVAPPGDNVPGDQEPAPEEPPEAQLPGPQPPDGGGSEPTGTPPPVGGAGAADRAIEPTDGPNPADEPDRDRFSERAALVGFLGTFLTGLVVVAVTGSARTNDRFPGLQAEPFTTPHGAEGYDGTRIMPTVGAMDGQQSVHDRATLIHALIQLRDRATSTAIGERIDQTLREVDVVEDAPIGQRFDPARHSPGGSEPAPDPGSRGVVSDVEITGYRDRDDSVLRAPVVTVYR